MKLFVATKAFIEREGKILLLREADTYKDGTEIGKWDVPGGRINPEEPLQIALAREIKEESGLTLKESSIFDVHETFPIIHGEACHIVRIYYRASAEGEVELSDDHDCYEWVKPTAIGEKKIMEDVLLMLNRIEKEAGNR